MFIYFSLYKRHNVLFKSRRHENIDKIYAARVSLSYYTTQVFSTDLFSHPKVREMFRKSREINLIHFYEV